MSIYSATNLYPNGISIKHSVDNTFEWTYNGSGTQTHYQLQIYLNSNNSLIYNSTKLSSSNEYHLVPSSTLTDNKLYKFRVTTWDGTDTATSNWVIFYTQSVATLTIVSTPTDKQTYEFEWTYNQTNDIPLKTFEAFLYLSSDLVNPIAESGIQYPTTLVGNADTISYTFDGMVSGTEYSVQAIGITQYDEEVDSGTDTFTVTYTYPSSILALEISVNNEDAYINLDWTQMLQVLGFVVGSSSYTGSGKFNKGLDLTSGAELYYLEDVPEDFTFIGWYKLASGYKGYIIELLNTETDEYFKIFYNGEKFGFEIGDYITTGRDASSLIGTFVLLAVKHGKLIIIGNSYQEILYG